LSRTLQTLLHKGRPFISRRVTGKVKLPEIHLDGFGVNQEWTTKFGNGNADTVSN
jgi:hypothetical protein